MARTLTAGGEPPPSPPSPPPSGQVYRVNCGDAEERLPLDRALHGAVLGVGGRTIRVGPPPPGPANGVIAP